MAKWLLTASVDAVDIDYTTIIESDGEPDFWTCYHISQAAGCEWWTVDAVDADND